MPTKKEVAKHAQRAVNVGLGLAQMVGEQLNTVLSGLEKDGHINRTEGKRLAKDLLKDVNTFQKKLSTKVDKKVKRVVQSSGTVTKTRSTSKRKSRKK